MKACVRVLAVNLVLGSELAAQVTTPGVRVIPGTSECGNCRITATKVWSFSEETGELIPKVPNTVIVDSKGRVLVARGSKGPPIVFDNRGRFLRTIGSTGDGPGESRDVADLLLAENDTVIALDRRLERMMVYSPDGRNVRQAQIHTSPFCAVWSPARMLILQAAIRGREAAGMGLHVFDRRGNRSRSFGPNSEAAAEVKLMSSARHIATAGQSAIWVMPGYGHFLVEKWSLAGERTSAWSIELPWFPRDGEFRYFKPEGRDPSPQISGLVEGPDNRLWIVATVANPNWRKIITTWRRTEGVTVPAIEEVDKARYRMVVVLDTRTGRVQATQRFDGTFGMWAGPGMLTRYVVDENGKTTLEIHKLSLSRAPANRDR